MPPEYAPKEDRGAFFIMVNGPEGASYAYMKEYMDEIERRLMPYTQSGEITRLLVRAPRSFGNTENFNSGIVVSVLDDWARRRSGFAIMNEISARLADLPGSVIDFRRGPVIQGLMGALGVVEPEVGGKPLTDLSQGLIVLEVHLLILDGAPQPLHKDVVECPALAIHADAYPVGLEHAGKVVAGERAALIGMKISGGPKLLRASCNASTQNSVSRLLDRRQASTFRLCQSIMATR
jgi:hypothetical protein